jgi:hypothetical protein
MKVTLLDSEGTELQLGDLLLLQHKSNGYMGSTTHGLTFYTRLQFIGDKLYPLFNGFHFDRIIKIDSLPDIPELRHSEAKDEFPEFWMYPKAEMYLIQEEKLDKWRMDNLMMSNNSFIKLSES